MAIRMELGELTLRLAISIIMDLVLRTTIMTNQPSFTNVFGTAIALLRLLRKNPTI